MQPFTPFQLLPFLPSSDCCSPLLLEKTRCTRYQAARSSTFLFSACSYFSEFLSWGRSRSHCLHHGPTGRIQKQASTVCRAFFLWRLPLCLFPFHALHPL